MIAIDVHQTGSEYLVVRITEGRSAPEWISCRSREELGAVLVVLGVADAKAMNVLQLLEWSPDVETRV